MFFKKLKRQISDRDRVSVVIGNSRPFAVSLTRRVDAVTPKHHPHDAGRLLLAYSYESSSVELAMISEERG